MRTALVEAFVGPCKFRCTRVPPLPQIEDAVKDVTIQYRDYNELKVIHTMRYMANHNGKFNDCSEEMPGSTSFNLHVRTREDEDCS